MIVMKSMFRITILDSSTTVKLSKIIIFRHTIQKSNAERNKRLLPFHRYAWMICNTKEEEGRKSEYKII